MTFVPFNDKVLIRPIERETVIKTSERKLEEMGEVISVGQDVTFVKPGDIVFFRSFAYSKTPEYEGERYHVISMGADFILGKVEA